jgi:hypothetical protein
VLPKTSDPLVFAVALSSVSELFNLGKERHKLIADKRLELRDAQVVGRNGDCVEHFLKHACHSEIVLERLCQ